MLLFVKNLVFTLLVPATVAGYVPWRIARGQPAGNFAIASIFFAIGVSIYLWCVWDFAAFGGGTPAPIDAPKRLVVRGLYRYTRNPMYIGVLLTIAGWAVLFSSWHIWFYAFCAGSTFHLVIVLYEEPHLHRVFGAAYEQYCSRVGRWFP